MLEKCNIHCLTRAAGCQKAAKEEPARVHGITLGGFAVVVPVVAIYSSAVSSPGAEIDSRSPICVGDLLFFCTFGRSPASSSATV